MSPVDKTINYIELPLKKATATKKFYGDVFGWTFQDWGPHYISFAGAGIDGGFNGEDAVSPASPGILIVLYAEDLEQIESSVRDAGAAIIKPIYAFPGGRRFHFHDPNGNELAIWSDK